MEMKRLMKDNYRERMQINVIIIIDNVLMTSMLNQSLIWLELILVKDSCRFC